MGDGTNYTMFEADGSMQMVGNATVWDDLRINAGSVDRPGSNDPSFVTYAPTGSGLSTQLLEFQTGDWASFTVQMPHSYKSNSDIYVHLHWTAGSTANQDSTVGWKVDYSWASIGSNFPEMDTAVLTDTVAAGSDIHQMTQDVKITGTDKGISSMLICNVRRTDTGADDTWDETASGSLPMLLEIDFHYEIDIS